MRVEVMGSEVSIQELTLDPDLSSVYRAEAF